MEKLTLPHAKLVIIFIIIALSNNRNVENKFNK